jgi:hypothetical protein
MKGAGAGEYGVGAGEAAGGQGTWVTWAAAMPTRSSKPQTSHVSRRTVIANLRGPFGRASDAAPAPVQAGPYGAISRGAILQSLPARRVVQVRYRLTTGAA